jgi:ubiquinone/menaquinone biosynthesis C-methylase UbiE
MSDSKSLSKDRYNKYAQGYVESKTHAKGAELDRLIEIAQPQSDWIALDVATGGGHTALKFAPYVHSVLATDLTPNMLSAAENHIRAQGLENVEFKIADAENLPLENDTFDLVTCRIAPHHFPDPFKFVQEATRVLKPGGLLLVQDQVVPDDKRAAHYVNAFEKLRDPSHNHALAEYEWTGMYLDAELTIEHTEKIIKQHDFVAWTKIQECPPDVVERLVVMMRQAPPIAAEWMQPRCVGTPEATFVNHHLIIAGRK